MTDLEYLRLKKSRLDYYAFSERVGFKMDSDIPEEEAQEQAYREMEADRLLKQKRGFE